MTGIKLMMLGGGAAKEAPGQVSYSAGYTGGVYEPEGWTTVDLELKGVCGADGPTSSSFSTVGRGSKVTRDGVDPAAITLDVGNKAASTGSYGADGGAGGTATVTAYSASDGGASTAAYITGLGVIVVAAGGGGDAGGPHGKGQPELGSTTAYSTPTTKDGGDGITGRCYYCGGGGGGGGTLGGNGGQNRYGGVGGGGNAGTGGSINYTARTTGNNSGNGSAKVSWG